jgi:hypothetical protein
VCIETVSHAISRTCDDWSQHDFFVSAQLPFAVVPVATISLEELSLAGHRR